MTELRIKHIKGNKYDGLNINRSGHVEDGEGWKALREKKVGRSADRLVLLH